jgi:hypothetical protein
MMRATDGGVTAVRAVASGGGGTPGGKLELAVVVAPHN